MIMNPYGHGAASGAYEQYTQVASQLAEMANIDASYVANSMLVNLFNKATITAGTYVSHANGNLVNSAGFWSSDFIPVTPNTAYMATKVWYRSFYDSN